MSLTVKDILKLPSLREARVAGGHGGLERIVSSISVLEYAERSTVQEQLFQSREFEGNEIAITAFAGVKDDVESQCANIVRMAKAGEVGLILYYVGILVPRVDERLIAVADTLDFVLIVMPENTFHLRYSEVICEVMEAVYNDRKQNTSLTIEILDRMSWLPESQRTVNTILQMVSDRVHASLVLLDSSCRVLNIAAWPRVLEDKLLRLLEETFEYKAACLTDGGGHERETGADRIGTPFALEELTVYPCRVTTGQDAMRLLAVWQEELNGQTLKQRSLLLQIVEIVQLGINLWSKNHEEIATRELVRAILLDEPMKMRRLAAIFHIDVASLHSVWMLCYEGGKPPAWKQQTAEELKMYLKAYSTSVLADWFEGVFFLFADDAPSLEAEQEIGRMFRQSVSEDENKPVFVCCNKLENTEEVRAAYLDVKHYLADAVVIFPQRAYYHRYELQVAGQCRELLKQGESVYRKETALLRPFDERPENAELLRTASAYLLDAQSSVTKTAALLNVHINTVKYRLQKASDLCGFRIGSQPETMFMYKAAAMRRLYTKGS